MIQEVIVTTINEDDTVHIAPMGIREENQQVIVSPYKPSATLENITRTKTAVVNRIDDVRIFAGCLTNRKDWELIPTNKIKGYRLEAALSHIELELTSFDDDELRPRFYCNSVYEETHHPFRGFNRAQAAVLELAILVSRLDRLPAEKIEQEIEYLSIAIEKTAGKNELTAWQWLMKKVEVFRKTKKKDNIHDWNAG